MNRADTAGGALSDVQAPDMDEPADERAVYADSKVWNQVRSELSETAPAPLAKEVGDSAFMKFAHWVNSHGRVAILFGVVIGLAVPDLAHTLRPYLSVFLVAVLSFSLALADFNQVRSFAKRGTLVVGLMIFLLIIAPTLIAIETKVVLVPYGLPIEIADGMILASLAPPLLAAPAIALLLGLDTVMALLVALAGHLVAPLAISILAPLLLGEDITFSEIEIMTRLALIIVPGIVIGLLARAISRATLRETSPQPLFEFLLVVSLVLLAIAITDGILEMTIADPVFMMWAIPCAFLLNPLLQLVGASIFVRAGYQTSLTVGLLAGYRNVGLIVVALAGIGNPKLMAFLAVVTVSAFVIPILSGPVLRKVRTVGFDDA